MRAAHNRSSWASGRRKWSLLIAVIVAAVAIAALTSGMLRSDAAAGPLPPALSQSAVAQSLAAANRPVVPGSLEPTTTVNTSAGRMTVWAYRVSDRANRPEILVTLGTKTVVLGGCQEGAAVGFCGTGVEGPGQPWIATGNATADISTIRIRFADGSTLETPVAKGYWAAALPPPDSHNVLTAKPTEIVGLDGSGHVVGHGDDLLSRFFVGHNREATS